MKYYIAGKHILLPNITPRSYEVLGWNWFNFKSGEWNSCAFESKRKAIAAYDDIYDIKEIDVHLSFDPLELNEELFEI